MVGKVGGRPSEERDKTSRGLTRAREWSTVSKEAKRRMRRSSVIFVRVVSVEYIGQKPNYTGSKSRESQDNGKRHEFGDEAKKRNWAVVGEEHCIKSSVFKNGRGRGMTVACLKAERKV